MERCIIGKLLRTVESGMTMKFTTSDLLKTEFPAIVFDDALTSDEALSFEPTVSPLNENKIDFRIAFDESNDEDYTVIFDENLFSYKIIYVDNLKTNSENDNDKVNMPPFPSPKPPVSYFNNLDYFKDFENEFPVIVYNDALMSKLDFLTEPTEQNVLYFNDLFPLNINYPDDLKSDEDNDDDEIQSSGEAKILTLLPPVDVCACLVPYREILGDMIA
ncbi:hypothetical protein Tco_0770233 [Tanacetum coccineum]|uniref:Reverse transcriptase domain-containing protein n=1 Tax=Tanacetum coccineum TaxID=301880 RepID=A0ABQ4ZF66_9ASTR